MFDGLLRKFSPQGREDVHEDNPLPSAAGGRGGQASKSRGVRRPRVQATRQEDAQEFLSYLMDTMHEELVWWSASEAGGKGQQAETPHQEEEEEVTGADEWEEVTGGRNRSAVTRHVSAYGAASSASRVTHIFGGQLRSVVKTAGVKPSATVQPFHLLQLNILPESVASVEDGLLLMTVCSLEVP
jgi:ubiquitin carboxyl-terminal hydrolase 10